MRIIFFLLLTLLCPTLSHAVLTALEKSVVQTLNTAMTDAAALATTDPANVTAYLTATQKLSHSVGFLLGNGDILNSNRAVDVASAWTQLDEALFELNPLPAAAGIVANLGAVDRSLTFLAPEASSFPWVAGLVGDWDQAVRRKTQAVRYLTDSALKQQNLTYSQVLLRLIPSYANVVVVLAEINEMPPSAQSVICTVKPLLTAGAVNLLTAMQGLIVPVMTPILAPTLDQYIKTWNDLDHTVWELSDHTDVFGPCPQ